MHTTNNATDHSGMIVFRPPRIALALVMAAAIMQMVIPTGDMQLYASVFAAVVFALTGFAIMLIAWWQFKKYQVAICPTAQTTRLLTDGIYRFTRNPMYLGITLMLTGIAFSQGGVPFYAAATGFFLIMNHSFCPYEEAKLNRIFGNDYRRYTAAVRRWI